MRKSTKEWEKIQKLVPFTRLMTEKQRLFVKELNEFLDPFEPFMRQKSENSLRWLNWLYAKYVEKKEIHW